MILIFDYFETLLNTKSMDFNRGLYVFWESYYRDKCPFADMKKYGEDLFLVLLQKHKSGEEYPFVKAELPLFAEKFGGEKVTMSVMKTDGPHMILHPQRDCLRSSMPSK